MREFFDRLSYKISEFMQGRYGSDDLNKAMLIVAVVFLIIQLILPIPVFSTITFILLFIMLFRSLSRNMERRNNENEMYLKIIRGPKKFFTKQKIHFQNRKTTKYFKCPGCKCSLSVPKGKGKIRIVCPKCKKEIYKTT